MPIPHTFTTPDENWVVFRGEGLLFPMTNNNTDCSVISFSFVNYVFAILFHTSDRLRSLSSQPRFNDWTTYFDTYLPLWLAGCSLLAVIFLLNCFWMNLISLMIVRELTNPVQPGESYDTRSDDESD